MLRLLQQSILYIFLILFLPSLAQINEGNTPISKKEKLIEKEKGLLRDAFKILNSSDDKSVVKIANHLIKNTKTESAQFNSRLLLAYFYRNRTMIDSSMYYLEEALKFNKVNNDSIKTKRRSLVYNILAINQANKGLYEESKKWHQKGITEAEKFKETGLYYTHLHGLASRYYDLKDYNQALKLYKECLGYKAYKSIPEIIYASYINISSIYAELKDYNMSNSYLEKALVLAKKDGNQKAIGTISNILGDNLFATKKYNEAINKYTEANTIANKYEFPNIASNSSINLGKVYYSLEQYQNAELIFSESLYKAIEFGLLEQQATVYQHLTDVSQKKGDYKTALTHVYMFYQIKDSIDQLQKDKEINELEVQYQTSEKVKEIKLLQAENSNRSLQLKNQKETLKNLVLQQEIERKESENKLLSSKNAAEKTLKDNIILKKNQELNDALVEIQKSEIIKQKEFKNIILYSFLVLLIPVIALLITYYQKIQTQSVLAQKEKEINAQKITSLTKDQELSLIKASIESKDKERKRIAQELHDSIGGNLAAIKLQLNRSNDIHLKTINAQIDDTYEQVRSISHNLIPKKFKQNKFCDVLEEYFKNIGETSNLNTSLSVFPRKEIDILKEELQIEVFKIIQELITNSIKHAKASHLELQLHLVDKELSILFEDDGLGFNAKNNTEGIGICNIRSRLYKISGNMHIDSRINRGTIINIEITNITRTTNEIQSNHS